MRYHDRIPWPERIGQTGLVLAFLYLWARAFFPAILEAIQ